MDPKKDTEVEYCFAEKRQVFAGLYFQMQRILLPKHENFRDMPMKTKELANEIINVLEEKLQNHVHDAKKLKKAIAKESEKLAKKISKLNRKEISTKQDPSEKAVKSAKKGKKVSSKSTSKN